MTTEADPRACARWSPEHPPEPPTGPPRCLAAGRRTPVDLLRQRRCLDDKRGTPAADLRRRRRSGAAAWFAAAGLVACPVLLSVATAIASPADASAQDSESSRLRAVPPPVETPAFMTRAYERGWRTTEGAPGENYWQQGGSYELVARLFPEEARLEGSVRILYASNAPGRFPSVWLHLHQNLHAEGAAREVPAEVTGGINVRTVAVDGEPLAPTGEGERAGGPGYRIDGTLMEIEPAVPLELGDTVEVTMDFDFIVPQRGVGRMGHSENEVFLVAYWFPKMAVLDDLRVWNADPYLGNAEFYDGFANYSAELSVPIGWTVMATGELLNPAEVFSALTLDRLAEARASDSRVTIAGIGERTAGTVTTQGSQGWLTYRFEAEQVRDFAWTASNVQNWDASSAVIGDVDGDGEDDRTLLHSFWRPERAPLWEEQWLWAQQSIEHHSRYAGFPYPWPHMTSVEGADIIEGGMEFPMLTLIGSYETGGPQDLFNVTSHEIGHMWIPMIVGTNEKRHAWMDEGTTTFLEGESRMEYWPGVDHHRVEARTYLRLAQAGLETSMMHHGDAYPTGPSYGVASYLKPSVLLVALRALIGREVFQEAYRSFIREWAFKHPTPWDFFNTFETVAGRDLDWFWSAYYFETWTMDHAVGRVAANPGAGSTVVVEDRGEAPFPATVRVGSSAGGTLEFEIPVEHWLEGNSSYQIELPPSAGSVVRVEIDPAGVAPDADRDNNIWPRG